MGLLLRYPNCYKKIFYFFAPNIRMSGKNINFEGRKIGKKVISTKNKKLVIIDESDVDKILVSK